MTWNTLPDDIWEQTGNIQFLFVVENCIICRMSAYVALETATMDFTSCLMLTLCGL